MNIFNLYKNYIIQNKQITPPEPTEWKGLCFTALDNPVNISYTVTGTISDIVISYSYDAETWSTLAPNTEITLNTNAKVYIKGYNSIHAYRDNSNYMRFNFTTDENNKGYVKASGNINSLYDNNDGSGITSIPTQYAYYTLFQSCSLLVDASELLLPSTSLSNYCYSSMFSYDTNLRAAPSVLPATSSTLCCYQNMFSYCSNLEQSPEIMLTNISSTNQCCINMFSSCRKLNSIKIHYTGIFQPEDSLPYLPPFNYWVNHVASSGTFYYNGNDTTRGISAIPSGWTVNNF